MRRRCFVSILLLGAVFVACGGGEEPPPDPKLYEVRGLFVRIEDDGLTMTVRHEEIPGYMATMTMPFKVQDASLLEGLEYGDKIRFELAVDSTGSVVTSIEELPEDTVLSFERSTP